MSRRSLLARLAVAILVIAFLSAAVVSQWDTVAHAHLRLRPAWLVLSAAAMLAGLAVQGELTVVILRVLGVGLPPSAGRRIFAAAVLARYVPTGSLAFVVRLQMNSEAGVSRLTTAFAILCEIALATAGAAVLAVPVLLDLTPPVAIAIALLGLAALAVVLPGPHQRLVRWAIARTGREPADGSLPIVAGVGLLAAFVAGHALSGLGLLCAARASTGAHLDTVRVVSSFGLGFLTSMLGFALPGGLGAREAGIVAGLAGALGGGLALAIAAISRLVQTAAELLYAGLAGAFARWGRTVPERSAAR